jgi:carbamoyltransferase
MRALGIHTGRVYLHEDNPLGTAFHDAAAVLVEDGHTLAAVEEERLTRMKHCNCFPVNAVKFCLEFTGTSWDQVDAIAINKSFAGLDIADKFSFLAEGTQGGVPGAEEHLAGHFQRAFGIDARGKFRFCHHQLAHAWSAFAVSGFDRALVISLDGDGDDSSGMVFTAKDSSLQKLREFSVQQSLGNLYSGLISLLGYSRFDEYKVMGLAPYGDPERYARTFSSCYELLPDGGFQLASLPGWLRICDAAGLLQQARRAGEPFTQQHKDLAAGIQAILETIVMHVLVNYQARTAERNLALAGGVAHNCTMNGRILRSGLFEKIFVQPAAHDAGGALGAAFWACYSAPQCSTPLMTPPPRPMTHLYYGPDIGCDHQVEQGLKRWNGFIEYRRSQDIAAQCAELLAGGGVVAWVQGRSEFGPRALGNRSILADPRPASNKSRINEMVKKREAYRPFAPSVLEDRMHLYFDVPPNCSSLPFMIFVVPVKESFRHCLGAITHVDGTARVHTVSREANPLYWNLISEFERITGIGMVLNTSFNNNAEPIVENLDDAVVSFLTTNLSYLAVGNFIVSRRSAGDQRRALLEMHPGIPVWRTLVKRTHINGSGQEAAYGIKSVKSREFGQVWIPLSKRLFFLLQFADGRTPVTKLLRISETFGEEREEEILDELLGLWQQRAVILNPAS